MNVDLTHYFSTIMAGFSIREKNSHDGYIVINAAKVIAWNVLGEHGVPFHNRIEERLWRKKPTTLKQVQEIANSFITEKIK